MDTVAEFSADHSLRRAAFPYLIVLAGVAALSVGLIAIGEPALSALISESGPVEILSALLHFGCLAFALIVGGVAYARKYPYFLAVPLLMGLRELDFDRRFTTEGILTSRLYAFDTVPLHEKLIGAVVVVVLLSIVVTMVRRHLRPMLTRFREHASIHLGVVTVLFLCVVSFAVDGLPRRVSGFIGTTEAALLADYPVLAQMNVFEEAAELAIPIVLLMMFSTWFRQQRRQAEARDAHGRVAGA